MHPSSYHERLENLRQQSQRPQRKQRRVVDEAQRAENADAHTERLTAAATPAPIQE